MSKRFLVVADCQGEKRILDTLPTRAEAYREMGRLIQIGWPMLAHTGWRIEERGEEE